MRRRRLRLWFLGRRVLIELLVDQSAELDAVHVEVMDLRVENLMKAKRIRELQDQNMRVIEQAAFQQWEADMRKAG